MAARTTRTYNRKTTDSSPEKSLRGRESLYVEGNAVRKSLTIEFPEEQEQHRRRGDERGTKKRAVGRESSNPGIGYMMALGIACVVILYMCVGYLKLQADNAETLENIADLEEQLDELETENNDEYNRIISSVDLDEIREKAINELGMVYAGEDQVVFYDGSENDYVTQYEDIPEEESTLSEILGYIKTGG